MEYSALIEELYRERDEAFAEFQRRMVCSPSQKIIGVRTPVLRKILKKYRSEWRTLLTFSDEYYEITFLKLNAVAALPYEEFSKVVCSVLPSIDNWATCDTFKAKCIASHREEFLPFLHRFLQGATFEKRYALTTLLAFYVEEKYLDEIARCLKKVDTSEYYVSMAAAWLTAEVLARYYERGKALLPLLDEQTRSRAIRKGIESFRIDGEKKKELRFFKKDERNFSLNVLTNAGK